jgi:ferredoxin-NADP reductase/ferredoxin
MPIITYEERVIECRAGDSVLDAMLDSGESVPHSCRSGICRCCMMRAVSGDPGEPAQAGLSLPLREKGFFLPCVCRPTDDLVVAKPTDAIASASARVERVEIVGRDVARVLVSVHTPFEYRPGQFVNIVRSDGLARSYSVANTPTKSGTLELHVRRVPGGQMSGWLHDTARSGEAVEVRGPFGECHYQSTDPDEAIVLIGVGTGLAPLMGVLRDAVTRGHRGPISLLHGARDPGGFYLVNDLRELARSSPAFSYYRCALEGEPESDLHIAPLDTVLRERVPSLAGRRVFICGDPAFVKAMRKTVFLAGAPMKAIHSDSFIASVS